MSSTTGVDMRLEISTIKVMHESIIQSFKAHKKFIEKEVTLAVNKVTLVRKQNKGKPAALSTLDT